MKKLIVGVTALAAIAAIVAGTWVYVLVARPYRGYTAPETFVEIPQGSGPATMARRLSDAGVVRNPTAFRIAVWVRGAGRRLQAGEYRFDQPLTPAQVVDKLVRGEVYLRAITFREGLTIRQMAQVFADRGFGPADGFVKAASDGSRVAAYDPDARDLEGYLFPDTYPFPRTVSAATGW